jgi:hypothetical protein
MIKIYILQFKTQISVTLHARLYKFISCVCNVYKIIVQIVALHLSVCINAILYIVFDNLKSLIYNVIYENLVFIKHLIHKVNGSILFCLHNHNEQFTMEPVLFESHKLDCLIPMVKSWLILKGCSRWN